MDNVFEKLSIAGLQQDFNWVLTNFYEINEQETENTEIELERIRVISIDYANKKASIEVIYTKETDTRDKETIHKEIMDWTIRPAIITNNEIKSIEGYLNSATTSPTIDKEVIKDLKEYYFGEKDNDYDLDDLLELDDKGIFDLMAMFNKKNNKDGFGGMIGYEITLGDIFDKLLPDKPARVAVNLTTKLFAPSRALNNTYLYPSSTGSLQYKYDEVKLKEITKADILTYTTKDQLTSILKVSQTNTIVLSSVESILITEEGPLLKLTVTFTKESGKIQDVVSINPALLKQ